VDVADLPGRGREKGVAFVPGGGGKFGERGQRLVDGVARELRVGHVALDAAHRELATERAAAAVFDHVAAALHRGGLADDAPVEPLAARAQVLDHDLGAIDRRAFLVAREQQGDLQMRLRRGGEEFLDGDDEGGDRGLHVARAASVELAAALRGQEGVAAPVLERARGHDVGVACEYYCFRSFVR
jgi:hypothetical protein